MRIRAQETTQSFRMDLGSLERTFDKERKRLEESSDENQEKEEEGKSQEKGTTRLLRFRNFRNK